MHVDEPHTRPFWQSPDTTQFLPSAHGAHVWPQSTSVSRSESYCPFMHGALVGEGVGVDVGLGVGAGMGDAVGPEVGVSVVGSGLGCGVGAGVTVGSADGGDDGVAVGAGDGQWQSAPPGVMMKLSIAVSLV